MHYNNQYQQDNNRQQPSNNPFDPYFELQGYSSAAALPAYDRHRPSTQEHGIYVYNSNYGTDGNTSSSSTSPSLEVADFSGSEKATNQRYQQFEGPAASELGPVAVYHSVDMHQDGDGHEHDNAQPQAQPLTGNAYTIIQQHNDSLPFVLFVIGLILFLVLLLPGMQAVGLVGAAVNAVNVIMHWKHPTKSGKWYAKASLVLLAITGGLALLAMLLPLLALGIVIIIYVIYFAIIAIVLISVNACSHT